MEKQLREKVEKDVVAKRVFEKAIKKSKINK